MPSIFLPERGVFNIYHFLIFMIAPLRNITFIPDTIYLNLEHEYFKLDMLQSFQILSGVFMKTISLPPSAKVLKATRLGL